MAAPTGSPDPDILSRLENLLDDSPPTPENPENTQETKNKTEETVAQKPEGEGEESPQIAPEDVKDAETDAEPSPSEVAAASDADEDAIHTLTDLAKMFEVEEKELLDHLELDPGDGNRVPLSKVIDTYKNAPEAVRRWGEFQAKEQAFETESAQLRLRTDESVRELAVTAQTLLDMTQEEFKDVDWKRLELEEPSQYLILKEKQRERGQAIQGAIEKLKSVENQRSQEDASAANTHRASEITRLHTEMPEWANQEVAQKAMTMTSTYLSEVRKFSQEEINNITDHRYLLVAHDAAQWQNLQTQAPGKLEKIALAAEAKGCASVHGSERFEPGCAKTSTEELRPPEANRQYGGRCATFGGAFLMAIITDTFETFDSIGMREDLSDIIYNIAPTETPFMMMIGRGNAVATTHEWQIDSLATEDQDNKHIEGDEAAFTAVVPTIRVNNFTQISRKTVIISGTAEVVDKAGRKSELAYQLAKMAKELKRDMESVVIAGRLTAGGIPQFKRIGSSDVAAQMAPFETWITVGEPAGQLQPQNRASDGVAPTTPDFYSPTDVTGFPTEGTQRAFKEADLKEVIREAWQQGGDPSVIMVGPFNKQALSAFSGNTTRFDRSEDMRLVTAVDVYVSDFGEHRVVPNRFSRDRSALVITPRMWSVDYLRGFRQFALAKTGDAEKRELLAEYTLRASNPHASGAVFDLTTS